MNRLSDCLVFPSRFLRNWYVSRIGARISAECKVIYPGVSITPLSPAHAAAEIVKIDTLSRLHPVKGIDRLIDACNLLKAQQIRFELIIGGEGKHHAELLKLVKKHKIEDCCRFCGEISDRQSFLDALDIFVAPSRQEAFGIHICEAMERGLAVVGANVGGIPELIDHDQTGMLFNPENAGELANTLIALAHNSLFRQTLGQNARRKVEKTFSRQTAIDKHIELFSQVSVHRRRVHFAISSKELGGGERVALGIMVALQARGWQVSATCSGNPLEAEIKKTGIPVDTCNMRCGGLFFALKLLFSICFRKPDVISSHLNRASLFAGLLGKLTRVPVVSHIHGLNQKGYYRFSDALVAVSQAVKKHMTEQNARTDNINAITNQIDKYALKSRDAAGNPLRIAITAKLHKNKGHLWALEAIASNIEQLATIRIDIFGDGPEREVLEKYCNNSSLRDRVFFHGFVNDPEAYYDQIDIALLPSLGEGIPLSLLESMRWGIPCIASNIGGIPEIIEHDKNGMLIEPGDAKALIGAIRHISANYQRFSIATISHFKSINNYPEMIDKLEDLLKKTIRAEV
jgi:glycosyltransferase involved in cell wall biosynthesis